MARVDQHDFIMQYDLRTNEDTYSQLQKILTKHPDWCLITYHQSHHDVHGNFTQSETHIVAEFIKTAHACLIERGDGLRWGFPSEHAMHEVVTHAN